MKRALDLAVSGLGLVALAPILAASAAAVWISDREPPLFISTRCGRDGKPFRMIKFRTMVQGAHLLGVWSTANTDARITPVGEVLRSTKLDELPQLINVFKGDMSLVGPRPNIQHAVDCYSEEEKNLLSVRPGITDLASIVFADEGTILESATDPDLAYEQLIRPSKSRLGLFYVHNGNTLMDLRILWLTVLQSFSRNRALKGVVGILADAGAPEELQDIASRSYPLCPSTWPVLDQSGKAPDSQKSNSTRSAPSRDLWRVEQIGG